MKLTIALCIVAILLHSVVFLIVPAVLLFTRGEDEYELD